MKPIYGTEGLTPLSQTLMRLDSRALAAKRADLNARFLKQRIDSLSDNKAFHFARELEYVYSEVLRTQYAPNSALDLITVDTSVPAGAKTHTVQRIMHEGEARYYRGNDSNRGSTGVSRQEEEFPVVPIVTSIKTNFFENLSVDYAQTSLRSELEFAAQQIMNDFLNDKTWNGDDSVGMRGVLNYPWLPKLVVSTPFTDASSADSILLALHRIANLSSENSQGLMTPTRMVMSITLRNYLSTRKRSSTSDATILDCFLKDNQYIGEVIGIPEFKAAGPSGEDAIFCYSPNRMSCANVIPRGFTMLPMQEQSFEMEIPIYMIHGGVIMRDALGNLLAYVTV